MSLLTRISSSLIYTRDQWRALNSNWIISTCNKFVLLFFVLSLIVIIWRWKLLPPAVPLWYSKPWGDDRLAQPAWLFILPTANVFWYSINLIMATFVTTEYLVFTQILFLSSLLTSFLSFVTLLKILFLVT